MTAIIYIKADSPSDLQSAIKVLEKSDLPISIESVEVLPSPLLRNPLTPDEMLAIISKSNDFSA